MKHWTIFLLFICCLVDPTFAIKDLDQSHWDTLKGLNDQSKEISEPLQKIINTKIKIAGFIVPLELDETIDRVKEFVLVPDPLSCIHVPPPPPNQMIYVKMNQGIPLDMDMRGVEITGKLLIASPEIQALWVGFEMIGESAVEADIEFTKSFDHSQWDMDYEYDILDPL